MSFLQLEGEKVLADADDNRTLEAFLRDYKQTKEKYEQAEKRIEELAAEVERLKEANRKLEQANQRQEGTQKQKHSHSAKEDHTHHLHPHSHSYAIQKDELLPFSQTHSSYFHVQQTKRKVINGFVAELTSELQSSEQLLAKERRMHEELRRSLQASHDENLALKSANRTLEGEMAAVMAENRQLLSEVSQIQAKKDALESQLQRGAMEMGWRRGALGRRSHQIEEQLRLMDSIYEQIQAQLQVKQLMA